MQYLHLFINRFLPKKHISRLQRLFIILWQVTSYKCKVQPSRNEITVSVCNIYLYLSTIHLWTLLYPRSCNNYTFTWNGNLWKILKYKRYHRYTLVIQGLYFSRNRALPVWPVTMTTEKEKSGENNSSIS